MHFRGKRTSSIALAILTFALSCSCNHATREHCSGAVDPASSRAAPVEGVAPSHASSVLSWRMSDRSVESLPSLWVERGPMLPRRPRFELPPATSEVVGPTLVRSQDFDRDSAVTIGTPTSSDAYRWAADGRSFWTLVGGSLGRQGYAMCIARCPRQPSSGPRAPRSPGTDSRAVRVRTLRVERRCSPSGRLSVYARIDRSDCMALFKLPLIVDEVGLCEAIVPHGISKAWVRTEDREDVEVDLMHETPSAVDPVPRRPIVISIYGEFSYPVSCEVQLVANLKEIRGSRALELVDVDITQCIGTFVDDAVALRPPRRGGLSSIAVYAQRRSIGGGDAVTFLHDGIVSGGIVTVWDFADAVDEISHLDITLSAEESIRCERLMSSLCP